MRWVVGLLLVVAALLKAVDVIRDPAVLLAGSWALGLTSFQIALEAGLGLLILSGLYWARVRLATLILFAGFAIYSLYQAIGGAASCGCFGPVKVSPWWTFLLDIAVMAGILVSIKCHEMSPVTSAATARLAWLPKRLVVAGFVGFVVISAAILGRYISSRTAMAGDSLPTSSGLIILEPEAWIGKRLPITKAIDLDVSRGKWILLLHRHDCPQCQEAVPKYAELAERITDRQIALVAVPPYDVVAADQSGECHFGQLSDEREWFVQTPMEIQLRDGIVTRASHDLPALAQAVGN